MSSVTPDTIVELTTAAHELEAGFIVARLENAGLRAKAAGELTTAFRAKAPGRMQIYVRAGDLERAREILKQPADESDPVDWSQVDVGVPEDGAETEQEESDGNA